MARVHVWIDRFPVLRKIIYFFPVQLILVQLKKNPVLIAFWIILFGFLSGSIASRYGVFYLFVDPEYLGKVNFLSYLILGFACGGFVMAYQISCYIHNAFRFPFLATLRKPFLRFSTNNFIIPFSFQLTYLILALKFLSKEDFSSWQMTGDVLGFIIGNAIFILGSLLYFFRTGKDMESLYGVVISEREMPKPKRVILNRDPNEKTLKWKTITPGKEARDWTVHSYIGNWWKIKRARPFEHYDKELLNRIFIQNHGKAVLFEIIVLGTLLIMGIFRQVPVMMIPAGASIFLLFTLYLMFSA
ncbi:MAG TPA: hypothetical protein VFU15_00805, partial [Bacteroidia bacterium]|nr:hypothetical protein [Bacteroidia bacterium]